MNDNDNRIYQMFGRVQTFGQDNLADFVVDSRMRTYLGSLGQIIAALDRAKAMQQSNTSVSSKEAALEDLRLELKNVSRTAAAIAQDQPGFADPFDLPEPRGHTSLRTAADLMIKKLKETTVLNEFLGLELPADPVKALEAARQAVEAAAHAEASSNSDGVESTAAISRLIHEGRRVVGYLNAIMHNKYTRQPEKLRAWKSASHIERAPRHEPEPAPEPAAPAVTTKPAG